MLSQWLLRMSSNVEQWQFAGIDIAPEALVRIQPLRLLHVWMKFFHLLLLSLTLEIGMVVFSVAVCHGM